MSVLSRRRLSKRRRRTTCKVCGKPLSAFIQQHGDEYCSTTCCRKDHGLGT